MLLGTNFFTTKDSNCLLLGYLYRLWRMKRPGISVKERSLRIH